MTPKFGRSSLLLLYEYKDQYPNATSELYAQYLA